MRVLVVETPEGVELRHEVAGAGSRSAAALLDLVFFGTGWLSLVIALLVASQFDFSGLSEPLFYAMIGGGTLLLTGYHVLFGVLWEGQSPGKRALGIRVTSANGYPAAWHQHLMRGLFLVPEMIALVGLVLMVASSRSQRLGDHVAGTLVLREPRARRAAEPFAGETWSGLAQRTLPLVPALGARLGADDHEHLRELLSRQGLEREQQRRLYVRTARHYAALLGLGAFDDARVFLKELYLYSREHRGESSGAGPAEEEPTAAASGSAGA